MRYITLLLCLQQENLRKRYSKAVYRTAGPVFSQLRFSSKTPISLNYLIFFAGSTKPILVLPVKAIIRIFLGKSDDFMSKKKKDTQQLYNMCFVLAIHLYKLVSI